MPDPEAQRRRQRRAQHCRSIGKLGGLTTSAAYDSVARSAKARATFDSSFEAAVRARDPDLIDEVEIARRAAALKRLHYARMALRRWAKVRATDAASIAPDGSK
jgi:hypothetical protein